ncbi:MAG: D-glycero-alpha-D-manno-heptose-1,7-bisphosphate 7-phosphatase [Bacteroidia bacterium]
MTLFLDRDGVLNRRLMGDYVKFEEEWEWLPNVLESLVIARNFFRHIIVVSNQQGVGKGLMTYAQTVAIFEKMKGEAAAAGVLIDAYYFCPHLANENCACRKPNIGMALQAQADFPEIDFSQSVMVGDSPSDIAFGKKLGMKTVGIGEEAGNADEVYDSLYAYLTNLIKK